MVNWSACNVGCDSLDLVAALLSHSSTTIKKTNLGEIGVCALLEAMLMTLFIHDRFDTDFWGHVGAALFSDVSDGK